jgi:hypothetical protein
MASLLWGGSVVSPTFEFYNRKIKNKNVILNSQIHVLAKNNLNKNKIEVIFSRNVLNYYYFFGERKMFCNFSEFLSL